MPAAFSLNERWGVTMIETIKRLECLLNAPVGIKNFEAEAKGGLCCKNDRENVCLRSVMQPRSVRCGAAPLLQASIKGNLHAPSLLKKAGCGQLDLQQLFNRYAERGQYQFLMHPDAARHCKTQIQLMIDGLQDTSALGSYTNFVRMLSFLQTVAQTVVHTKEKIEPLAANDPMHEVLNYINEHYVQHITLEELARHFGISASLLSHKFVMYTGRSVYDYVLYRRVLQAKEMINSSLALSEVAYQCGFNDYSCFLRAFRRVTGMSPNAYRKYAKELFQ